MYAFKCVIYFIPSHPHCIPHFTLLYVIKYVSISHLTYKLPKKRIVTFFVFTKEEQKKNFVEWASRKEVNAIIALTNALLIFLSLSSDFLYSFLLVKKKTEKQYKISSISDMYLLIQKHRYSFIQQYVGCTYNILDIII